MSRLLVATGALADSAVFWWLMLLAWPRLYHSQNIYEGCALVATAVLWQRHGKAELLREIRLRKPQPTEATHDQ